LLKKSQAIIPTANHFAKIQTAPKWRGMDFVVLTLISLSAFSYGRESSKETGPETELCHRVENCSD
jgi:hypothetical protein